MRRQRGFSLIELLMVVAILTIVMGVIFQQMASLQRKYRSEETKVDMFAEGREFVDQFSRDMHQAGYPSNKIYTTTALNNPRESDSRLAVGIVAANAVDLWFEGDIDGDGFVDSVRYTLCNSTGACGFNAGGRCPCTLQRSQIVKLNGTSPWLQPRSYAMEVGGVVNSVGMGGAAASIPIAGQSALVTGAGTVVQNDDVLFVNLKNIAVFTYYDRNGAPVNVNTSIATQAGRDIIRNIKSVQMVLNLVGTTADGQTGWKPYVTLGAIAKLQNCSMYSTVC